MPSLDSHELVIFRESGMRGRELWIVALLFPVLASGCNRIKAEPPKAAPPEVLYTFPTTDEVTNFEEFIGHTDAVNTVEVRARVTGYLDKVNFNDGDEIEKGALLFQIDDRPYKAEYERSLATLEQGKARYDRTNRDHVRAVNLRSRNAIGQEEFDLINGNFEEAKATVGVYTAALERAKLDLDFTKVTAPLTGRLSRRMVDPGNLVQADVTALTSIVSLDPMYVYFDIDERTLLMIRRLIAEKKMKSRTEAEVPVLAGLSDEAEFPHRGTINFSDNKVDSGTGTLRVRGVISNPKPRLLSPGLFVRIRLPIGEPRKSILIDEQAIGSEQSNKFVYVLRKSKETDEKTKQAKEVERAYARPIKVGPLMKGMRAVLEGLAEDDRVIISGLQRVKNAEPVTPILSKKDPVKKDDAPDSPKSPAEPPTTPATTVHATPPSAPSDAAPAK
jgi:multidrug efflux system membrane fusion protein